MRLLLRIILRFSQPLALTPPPAVAEEILEYIAQHGKLPDQRIRQEEKEPSQNPQAFNLPNRRQMDLLIGRLTRSRDMTRKQLLGMKEEAVPYLCIALLEHFNPWVRRECVLLLKELQSPRGIPSLILGLDDSEVFVQLTCVEALMAFESDKILPALKKKFFSESLSVYLKATLALKLAELGQQDIVEHLREQAEHFERFCKKRHHTPERYSKQRYLCWYLKEALSLLTGERNDFATLPHSKKK